MRFRLRVVRSWFSGSSLEILRVWYHISKVQGRKIILIFEKKKKKD